MQIFKGISNIFNSCLSCKYFIPDKITNRGMCKLFLSINNKNKTISYESIIHVRMDENKCGISANLYDQKKISQ
jgi:hypothetical protein